MYNLTKKLYNFFRKMSYRMCIGNKPCFKSTSLCYLLFHIYVLIMDLSFLPYPNDWDVVIEVWKHLGCWIVLEVIDKLSLITVK